MLSALFAFLEGTLPILFAPTQLRLYFPLRFVPFLKIRDR